MARSCETKSLGDTVTGKRSIQFLIKCTNNIGCITGLCIKLLNFIQLDYRPDVARFVFDWMRAILAFLILRRGITLSGVKKKSTLSCAGSGGVRVHATYAVDPCSNPSQRTLCCMSPPHVSHLLTVKNKGVYTWRNPYKQKRTSSTVDSFIWLLCSWITYPAQEKYCLLQGRRG